MKAWTAAEIHHFTRITRPRKSYHEVLSELKDAGLVALPGGGAEIFADRVRKQIARAKVSADGWLEVHRTAHELGLPTNATMLYGHIETLDDLRNLAVARLVLDNFPHIKGYWVMITPELTQVALSAGISDIDGTIKDEKIAHASGAVTEAGMTEEELVHLVQDAGRVPVRRDALYRELKVFEA